LFQAMFSSAPWWAWLGFHLLVLLMLALDLGVFNRRAHEPGWREAAWWSAAWVLLSLAFNGVVYNLFVFVLLFSAFQVPARDQHRILYWGVVGAMVLRAAMIAAGITLLNRFEWMSILFGAFLVFTGLKLVVQRDKPAADPRQGLLARGLRRILPFDPDGGHQHLWVIRDGRRHATPMLMLLIIIEATDLLFAVDSVPAVLAVTRDPFLVYTSNIFAILGLRSLYFLLARMMDRFHLLGVGLALILTFVGVKMCAAPLVEIPILASLSVIALVLIVCVAGSLARPREEGGTQR